MGGAATVDRDAVARREFGGEGRFFSSGDRWTKFVQYRDIPENFTVNSLDFSIGGVNNRWSLVGTALDAGQLDQRYNLGPDGPQQANYLQPIQFTPRRSLRLTARASF